MKLHPTCFALPSVLILFGGLTPPASVAQIIPDASLPVNSSVASNGNRFILEGGTQAAGNLFHSFQEFSLPTGTEAFFNNALDVHNIFTRVTGGNISNIDGFIRANAKANLFLLNPNGIVFGPNARLDIGGSFFGTTAERLHFSDGVEFSATHPQATPLVSINVPIGLQMGPDSGAITVQGSGHRLINKIYRPLDRTDNPTGLEVQAGNTQALIGNGVKFWGGIAAVNGGGHLEIGSASSGQVRLNATEQGWMGDYSGVEQFNDIHLAQQSLLDASGTQGSIQLQGRNISLTEGSVAAIQNLGAQSSGGISVQATESLTLTGNTVDGDVASRIVTNNLGTSGIGDMTISAAQLWLLDGGYIGSETFANATGSNLQVQVSGAIELEGFSPADPAFSSAIGTLALNLGNAGMVTLSTGTLRILNSGRIYSGSVGSRQTGMLSVNATESLEIAGNNPITLAPSIITSSANSSGNAKNVLINTSRLVVRDGAFLGSSTFATGSAASVVINAWESVDIQGIAAGSIAPSRIASTAEKLDPITQAVFGLPPIPIGESGVLTVNTPSLRIADGAFLTVKNDGPGRAGDLLVNANSIMLDNRGSITASTVSGNGGNIRLNLQERLQMRHGSLVSATAAGTGDGGNLSVNTPVLVGLENSDLVANAVRGRGGNIQIHTQGIFGLENRPQLTPDSDTTASSQFGVDGVVSITNPEVEPASSLVSLSQDPIESSEQVVAGCQWTGASEFLATGCGGVPAHPHRPLASRRTWSDVRDLSVFAGETVEAASVAVATPEPLVEATGWQVNEDGMVELVATANFSRWENSAKSGCNPLPNAAPTLRETPLSFMRN